MYKGGRQGGGGVGDRAASRRLRMEMIRTNGFESGETGWMPARSVHGPH